MPQFTRLSFSVSNAPPVIIHVAAPSWHPPSPSFTHIQITLSALHHSELKKRNINQCRAHRYCSLLLLEVLSFSAFAFPSFYVSVSPPVCNVRLKVLTFQRKLYIFLPEHTRVLIHSLLSSLTAQTHLSYRYLCYQNSLSIFLSCPVSCLSFL